MEIMTSITIGALAGEAAGLAFAMRVLNRTNYWGLKAVEAASNLELATAQRAVANSRRGLDAVLQMGQKSPLSPETVQLMNDLDGDSATIGREAANAAQRNLREYDGLVTRTFLTNGLCATAGAVIGGLAAGAAHLFAVTHKII